MTMQDEKVRIGLVGVGWFGGVRVASARKSGAAEFVACFDLVPERRDAFAAEHGCRAAESLAAMLGDPEVEAILVATPHSTHLGLVEEAASAGKHVFVEKPLVLSVADARRAAEATERAKVVLQVGHNRRRQPANRRIKAMLDGDELGTLLHLDGVHTHPAAGGANIARWRLDPAECPAGAMTALGIHTVDTFHYLAGPARRVVAISKRVVGKTKLDEATSLLIEYEQGAVGAITSSYFAQSVVSLGVYGTEGNAWNEEDGTKLFVQRAGEALRSPLDVETIDTVADELAEFARCVRNGAKPEVGAPEALEVAAVLEAIVESSSSGRAVELADVRGGESQVGAPA
jgi:predicted dehydrogenase